MRYISRLVVDGKDVSNVLFDVRNVKPMDISLGVYGSGVDIYGVSADIKGTGEPICAYVKQSEDEVKLYDFVASVTYEEDVNFEIFNGAVVVDLNGKVVQNGLISPNRLEILTDGIVVRPSGVANSVFAVLRKKSVEVYSLHGLLCWLNSKLDFNVGKFQSIGLTAIARSYYTTINLLSGADQLLRR